MDKFKCFIFSVFLRILFTPKEEMRMPKPKHVLLLLSLFVLSLSALSLVPSSVEQVKPLVYVDPTPIDFEPGESFNINITIKSAVNVFAWEFKLLWNASVLNYTGAVEGDFLKGFQNASTYWVNPVLTQNVSDKYRVLLGVTRLGADIPGVSGSGKLAMISFDVLTKGETTLDLVETKLRDSVPNPIDHDSRDGLFSNTAGFPRPDFSFTPAKANINETITFDASNSTDVDQGVDHYIVLYSWNFSDGTPVVEEAGAITYHAYSEGGTYDVTLTVMDNDRWNRSITKAVKVRFTYDVKVAEVKAAVESATIGDKVAITVKVSNEGSGDLTSVSVTAYYSVGLQLGTALGPAQTTSLVVDQTKTLSFEWDTSGVAKGSYRINAAVAPVAGEPEQAQEDNTSRGGTVTLVEVQETPWLLYGGIIAGVAVVAVVGFLFMRRRGGGGKQTPIR